MSPISFEDVRNLEDYIFVLGGFSVSIESLYKFQQHAITSGLLETDEMEQAKTIAYECARVFKSIENIVMLVSEKAQLGKIDYNLVAKRLEERANERRNNTGDRGTDLPIKAPRRKKRQGDAPKGKRIPEGKTGGDKHNDTPGRPLVLPKRKSIKVSKEKLATQKKGDK